jgi:conjugal transfer/entry exclusion protein
MYLKVKEVKEYFEEYKTANNIDFITYEQARINVTLSASMKSLKEQAKAFIDQRIDDLKLIETQEHKAEILVEYKQTLNVSNAITTVMNRLEAVEEEKSKIQENINQLENTNTPKNEPSVVQELQTTEEKIYKITFTVTGTAVKLKQLKQYLLDGGYQYE